MSSHPAATDALPGLVGGRYRTMSFRGSGAEGAVYLAVDLFTGDHVALKLGAAKSLAAEYARSAALRHPHLARALALWNFPGGAALALDYAAEDLTALRGAPEAEVVRHVAGVARALAYLHQRGVVHADVKPQNALLAGGLDEPAARRALLTDLGLAGAQMTSRGSLEYAAPEVLEGGAPTAASDLYSLGVTLHELLGGKNPFAGGEPGEVVRAHFQPIAPPPASSAVQAVVVKLLARAPRARHASANEVVEALAAATGLALESEGEGLALDRIGAGELYGRGAELARLEELAAKAFRGQGAALALIGPAGSGRSRLLRHFAVAAELQGLRVLRLGPTQGLAALCWWLGLLLGEGTGATEAQALARLHAASALHPLCVLVDDADADPALLSLAAAVARDPRLGKRALLWVAVSAQVVEPALQRMELAALPPLLARDKLLEALGPRTFADGLAALLVHECSGSPGELEEALIDLAARGLLSRRRGRWELDTARAGPDFAGCVPTAALVRARARVSALEPPLRSALGVASVLGAELDRLALAALLVGSEVDALVDAGLLLAEGGRLRFPTLSLLRAAERALPVPQLREAHLIAAAQVTGLSARAGHLFRARAPGALQAALVAARERLRAGAPAQAARLYQMARSALRPPLRSARAAVLGERAADCLALAGQVAAARCEYLRALDRGGSAPRLWQKLAKVRWQEGRFDEVLLDLSRARAAGGDALAIGVIEARAQAMRGDYQRAQELAVDSLLLARERGDGEAGARLHHLLGTCAWHRGDGRRAVIEERVSVLIARRLGDARAEADARAGLGTAYRLLAQHARSARETARAIELYAALGDERQEALAFINLGVAHYLASDWQGALDAWGKLGEKRSQTTEEQILNLNNLGFLYRERGDLARARENLTAALGKIAGAGGYTRLEAMVRGNLGEVAAREGDLAAADAHYQEALALARAIDARDELVETERRLAQLDLLRRNPAAANQRAGAAYKVAVEAGNLVEQGNLLGIVALAARARNDGPAAAQAVAAARTALEKASARLELARLDCIACLLDLDRGDAPAASATLRRARVLFEQLGAAPDLREVERLEGDIDALQRRSLSQIDALVHAAASLAQRGDPAALLEDVLDQALALTGAERGFILLHEPNGDPRVAAVRGADANATLHISRTVADRVLHTGEIVSVADIVGREQLSTQKSILDLGLRSVLCVPLRFGGRQLGILYVDSRRVGAMLSDKDLGLLGAFAALAGSALENARLVDDLRRKADLLAQMAHEFRSPLVGIKGYAELINMDPRLDPKVSSGLKVIDAQATRLANLINKTLELSRMEAGAVRLAQDKVALDQVVAAAVAGLKPLALIKSITVSIAAQPGTPAVLGEYDRLVQVVTNLVGNAIHYSDQGTAVAVRVAPGEPLPPRPARPRVEIEGAPRPVVQLAARPSAQIVVTDQGPGISEENRARLFTPFFRAGAAKGTGTGLGLVISREIVRQHGGDIRVESQPGKGTSFIVALPGAA